MPNHIENMGENDYRKDNLRMEQLKLEVSRDINNSGLTIGTVYYIIRGILKDIEELYNEQVKKEYEEFCETSNQNAAAAQGSKSEVKDDKSAVAANNIEEKEEK